MSEPAAPAIPPTTSPVPATHPTVALVDAASRASAAIVRGARAVAHWVWRRKYALAALVLVVLAAKTVRDNPPIGQVRPGEAGVRVNMMTGNTTVLDEGPCLLVPKLHELRRYPLYIQAYRTTRGARADGEAPYKSFEGLPMGVEVTVQYQLDASNVAKMASILPDGIGPTLVDPVVEGVLHRALAKEKARDIFSTRRAEIQDAITAELSKTLAKDGIVVRNLIIGNIDLPGEYRHGLEGLLSEGLAAEKMAFTIELKQKEIKERELVAEAEKVEKEMAAEASASAEVIAAKGKAEAMKHILPFKEKEIEQRKLEAEAQGAQRVKLAEADAQARRLEADAEADARRKLAEAEAYRLDVTGRATSEQMARDSALIAANPLLIQKTIADKLSDKIQVIVAPPPKDGFFADGLVRTSGVLPRPVSERGEQE